MEFIYLYNLQMESVYTVVQTYTLQDEAVNHLNPRKYTALTLILLTWRIWWAPNNASKWQMGFNSAFKGLNGIFCLICLMSIRDVMLVYESCLNYRYVSLFDNIHCLGTYRSHCHDACVMQNLNGSDMPYSWWLETYKINWHISDILWWQWNKLCSKDSAVQ
jgi:hypothetical protein